MKWFLLLSAVPSALVKGALTGSLLIKGEKLLTSFSFHLVFIHGCLTILYVRKRGGFV